MANRRGVGILLSVCAISIAAHSALAQAPPANSPRGAAPAPAQTLPRTASPAGAQVATGGQFIPPQNAPLAAPFLLSPQQQAELDALLIDWEKQNSQIKTFECSVLRLEYDATFGGPNKLKTESYGEVKYAAPDKGMFQITDMYVYAQDPKTHEWQRNKTEPEEHWTCDGKSTFQVDHKQKLVIETPIAPEMQGRAISDGPLPFVFGAKAESLKSRYYMRVTTPANVAKDQIWLEAFPKWQKDAANFAWVELILTKSSKVPYAIQIYSPGDSPLENHNELSRTMIRLDKPSVNNLLAPIAQWLNNFATPNPIGYRHVLQQNVVAPPAAPQTPAAGPPSVDQASRARMQPR